MRNVMAATALASSLIFAAALTAQAAPSFNLKSATGGTGNGLVELARDGGGGGKGGGGGGNGGGGMKSGGGGGGRGLSGGGMGRGSMDGGRRASNQSGGNNKFSSRGNGGGNNKYSSRGNDGGKYAGRRGGNQGAYHKGGKGRSYAGNNRYQGWNGRHRYYNRYAGGAYIYGGYEDCGVLLYRARQTGSPYWWSRYEACVY